MASKAETRVPVCFDVLGTCFTFDRATQALLSVFPDLDEERADSIIQDWFHSAQRDFTYLSINGDYQPIAKVLKHSLPRIYLMHHLVDPLHTSTTTSSHRPDDDVVVDVDADLVDPVLAALPTLSPRPSLAPCSRLLLLDRSSSESSKSSSTRFRLVAVTNGGLESTKNYFSAALGRDGARRRREGEGAGGTNDEDDEEVVEGWSFVSCDEIGVAKPDPRVYDHVWSRLGQPNNDDDRRSATPRRREGWFVASHSWDLHAAKKAG
ncbi:hypothetical protein JCM11491_005174 [Sporobolomyces phaffii]